jgi:hypothetical protein
MDVLIGCQKYFKSRRFRRSQQFAVTERIPTEIFGLLDCVLLADHRAPPPGKLKVVYHPETTPSQFTSILHGAGTST